MNKLTIFALIVIVIINFSLRLYKLDNPIADWHSFRQADTSAVTRNFLRDGIDVLHPHADDMSNIQSGQDNPHRYRMVEFPIYNLMHLGIFKINSVTCQMLNVKCLPLESSGRLTTVFLSMLSLLFLYGIVYSLSGPTPALITAAIFGLLPYNIYYSRVILPDPLLVTASLGAIYFFLKANSLITSHQSLATSHYLSSALFAATALLIKPTAIFTLAPIVFLSLYKFKQRNFLITQLPNYLITNLIFWIISFTPLILWRHWISQFPEGIPAYTWLLWQDIKPFQPAWFRWLFYERLTNLILGGFGLVFFILGIISKPHQNSLSNVNGHMPARPLAGSNVFYYIWLVSMLAYLAIFATGNVRHDYYQIMLIPIISIFTALGLLAIWRNPNFNKFLSISISLILIPLSLFISWYTVRGYYQINNTSIIEAGIEADQTLPADARVIAPYNGDTAFLYQTNRPGWPLLTYYPIQKMIDLGATHYISVNYDTDTKQLMQEYPILKQTEKYVILNLQP